MNRDERWWSSKWYWMLCILLAFILVPAIHLFFFPEIPLSRSLIYAAASAIAVLIAYFVYMKKPIFKIKPKTLRRIITIMGGVSIGLMIWGDNHSTLGSPLPI
ncbi:MAG: hypothetical protein QXP36_05045 [Conexivisphaerales archaeon]